MNSSVGPEGIWPAGTDTQLWQQRQNALRLQLSSASDSDLAVVEHQLQRRPRGVIAVAARCVCQAPLVVATAPKLPDGTPFPTTFYLTHPTVVKAASILEAEHVMQDLNLRLQEETQLAQNYCHAHELYLRQREFIGKIAGIGEVPEISHVSAGGMPGRVKCLHAIIGHTLASGGGINPVGDIVLEQIQQRGLWHPHACYCA